MVNSRRNNREPSMTEVGHSRQRPAAPVVGPCPESSKTGRKFKASVRKVIRRNVPRTDLRLESIVAKTRRAVHLRAGGACRCNRHSRGKNAGPTLRKGVPSQGDGNCSF